MPVRRLDDVRAAKNRFEAAQNARELARSLRTRDVTVGAQYDHYPLGTPPANAFGNGNSYGVFVSVPLFAGYYYEGEIRRAEVDYNTAMESLEKVRAQARTEIARAFSDLQATAVAVVTAGLLVLANSPVASATDANAPSKIFFIWSSLLIWAHLIEGGRHRHFRGIAPKNQMGRSIGHNAEFKLCVVPY